MFSGMFSLDKVLPHYHRDRDKNNRVDVRRLRASLNNALFPGSGCSARAAIAAHTCLASHGSGRCSTSQLEFYDTSPEHSTSCFMLLGEFTGGGAK
jgi:hypothetical protein